MLLWIARTVRLIVGWVDLALFTLFLLGLALLPEFLTRRLFPRLFRAWCRTFVRALRVELRLFQQHERPLPSQYILVSNHPSAFEDIGIPALFPVRSLAKEEVRDWWFVGRIAQAAGTLFVKRESPDSRQAAQQALIDAVKAGACIALYPEGGCKGRRIAPRFFGGAFVASKATGVPLLPVFLHYEAQESFEWADQHLLMKLWQIMTSPNPRANFYVFDPIDPGGFDSVDSLRDFVHNQYLGYQKRFLE
ncbi:MAG: 1-acyl-sn-glycerol-3-phosphate acyltransferase [Acidobacteriota bacterium]|nr:1-acyl-sn-glycerol-3-phosphate acyltransferase [Acidobacteriota bacterium]